jgi:hypothetical protein
LKGKPRKSGRGLVLTPAHNHLGPPPEAPSITPQATPARKFAGAESRIPDQVVSDFDRLRLPADTLPRLIHRLVGVGPVVAFRLFRDKESRLRPGDRSARRRGPVNGSPCCGDSLRRRGVAEPGEVDDLWRIEVGQVGEREPAVG